jgi:formylglycine-generating enzyme required for sulfatase activity
LNQLALPEAKRRRPGDPGWRAAGGSWTWRHDGKEWRLPAGWNASWPITAISRQDADAYARWRSEHDGRACRLPTEEEWEKAARGGDGRIWPWGDRFDSSFVHCAGSVHERATPSKVGAFTGDVSVYGVQDMGGNVREWTASEQRDGFAVVRGGSWTDTSESARCATRSFRPVSFRSGFIGFRLVSDAALPLAKGVRGKKP